MSSLSSPLQAIISVFSGPLQGVRFADIDGEGLSALAMEVENLGTEVEAHEAQLANLRESLAQKQETLLALAQQALAYARIYAESDEALSAELNDIALPRAAKPRKNSAPKPAPERAPRGSKEETEEGAPVDVSEDSVAEPPAPKPRRKAASAESEHKEEAAAPVAAGRRKLPTRTGRASR